jgi:nucleotide-binding universal stress UspA family protein
MQYLAPFDGTPISREALRRASTYRSYADADVTVLSVIPKNNATYAREHDWLGADESFDIDTIVSNLRAEATRLCPTAEFEYTTVGRYAGSGAIASEIRETADTIDADVVFLGSTNAGSVVTDLSSVGQALSVRSDFDIFLVRSE